eukprot:sb/3478010/
MERQRLCQATQDLGSHWLGTNQQPTESSKQPIITRHLGHVTGYQPIRDQYFLIPSVPGTNSYLLCPGFRSSLVMLFLSLLFSHLASAPPHYCSVLFFFTVLVSS